MELPGSPGHWVLQQGDDITYGDVAIRQDGPKPGMTHPFAFNNEQSDPCEGLTGDGRKVRDEYRGRLKKMSST